MGENKLLFNLALVGDFLHRLLYFFFVTDVVGFEWFQIGVQLVDQG